MQDPSSEFTQSWVLPDSFLPKQILNQQFWFLIAQLTKTTEN